MSKGVIERMHDCNGRFGRYRLWARALDSGCNLRDLASAYNVKPGTVTRGAHRYRKSLERNAT